MTSTTTPETINLETQWAHIMRARRAVRAVERRKAAARAECPYCAALDLDSEDDGLCWTCRGRFCEAHFLNHVCMPRW